MLIISNYTLLISLIWFTYFYPQYFKHCFSIPRTYKFVKFLHACFFGFSACTLKHAPIAVYICNHIIFKRSKNLIPLYSSFRNTAFKTPLMRIDGTNIYTHFATILNIHSNYLFLLYYLEFNTVFCIHTSTYISLSDSIMRKHSTWINSTILATYTDYSLTFMAFYLYL